MNGYCLRNVAGKHWLIDNRFRIGAYREPICMNETGAYICEYILKGLSDEDIAHRLSEERHKDYGIVLDDVKAFSEVVRSYIAD